MFDNFKLLGYAGFVSTEENEHLYYHDDCITIGVYTPYGEDLNWYVYFMDECKQVFKEYRYLCFDDLLDDWLSIEYQINLRL